MNQLILLLRSIVKRFSENAELLGTAPIESDKADRAFNVVESQWHSADEEMRQAIVEILIMLNGDRALVMLDTLMNDPDPWLRMRVIELLATLEDPRLPDFVARYITDEDEMVRSTVAWVLENKGCSFDSSHHA
jgi:HEAT repeat protein